MRAWPPGAVPWQYENMPRGQLLPRTTLNARVVAAVRLAQDNRDAVHPAPRPPCVRTLQLTDEEYTPPGARSRLFS